MSHLSRGLVTSRDKLKLLYLKYWSAYGHQTWQVGDLLLGATAHNVPLLLSHMALRDCVTNQKY